MTDRKEMRERMNDIIRAAAEAKRSGIETLKISGKINDKVLDREEMAFFLGRITEKVGLAVEEKYNFGSIITIDLR